MNVIRFDKTFISHFKDVDVPTQVRAVRNARFVRSFLHNELRRAEEAIDVENFKLLPYTLVLGSENIYPIATSYSSFDPRLLDIQRALRTKNPSKVVAALAEFELINAGILVRNSLEGVMSNGETNPNFIWHDYTVPMIGEPYGPHPRLESAIYCNGTSVATARNKPVNPEIKGELSSAKIVTLGPPDDVVGIFTGIYKYSNGWVTK